MPHWQRSPFSVCNEPCLKPPTRIGEKLSLKELGRDYKLVLKNGRFVAGALALGFVSLPLLAWIAQSPIIIITGEQLSSYEYGLLQVPIFGALIAGNLLLARLTSRRTVRSLIIMGGWPIMIGLLVAAAATVISSHAYLWMTARVKYLCFRYWSGECGTGAINPVCQRYE